MFSGVEGYSKFEFECLLKQTDRCKVEKNFSTIELSVC